MLGFQVKELKDSIDSSWNDTITALSVEEDLAIEVQAQEHLMMKKFLCLQNNNYLKSEYFIKFS